MSTAKHTELPWKLDPIYGDEIVAQEGKLLVQFCGDTSTSYQNALFVLCAVNSHYELLEACKLQHEAIDWLMARLIELDEKFMPSKSYVWPAVLSGNEAIAHAEAHAHLEGKE